MINKTIDLWEDYTYASEGEDGFRPTLDTYILNLNGNKKRGAVLICPGGAYAFTSEREAEPIAMQFNAAGYHAFVLYYSVAPRKHPQPLLDISRAMCIIRQNSDKWLVDTEKIAVCGFSAGGHLAASLGVHWNQPYLKESQGIEDGMNKPNALILSYPVISSGKYGHQDSFRYLLGDNPAPELIHEMSLEHHINQNTPPSFLWHTGEETLVPAENSLLFALGLRKFNIPFELHIYPKGPHGLSLSTEETATEYAPADPHAATWVTLCMQWLSIVWQS